MQSRFAALSSCPRLARDYHTEDQKQPQQERARSVCQKPLTLTKVDEEYRDSR